MTSSVSSVVLSLASLAWYVTLYTRPSPLPLRSQRRSNSRSSVPKAAPWMSSVRGAVAGAVVGLVALDLQELHDRVGVADVHDLDRRLDRAQLVVGRPQGVGVELDVELGRRGVDDVHVLDPHRSDCRVSSVAVQVTTVVPTGKSAGASLVTTTSGSQRSCANARPRWTGSALRVRDTRPRGPRARLRIGRCRVDDAHGHGVLRGLAEAVDHAVDVRTRRPPSACGTRHGRAEAHRVPHPAVGVPSRHDDVVVRVGAGAAVEGDERAGGGGALDERGGRRQRRWGAGSPASRSTMRLIVVSDSVGVSSSSGSESVSTPPKSGPSSAHEAPAQSTSTAMAFRFSPDERSPLVDVVLDDPVGLPPAAPRGCRLARRNLSVARGVEQHGLRRAGAGDGDLADGGIAGPEKPSIVPERIHGAEVRGRHRARLPGTRGARDTDPRGHGREAIIETVDQDLRGTGQPRTPTPGRRNQRRAHPAVARGGRSSR